MSNSQRISVAQLRARKVGQGAAPLVMLSCYHPRWAALADPHVDIILIGDSMAMTFLGHDDTLNTPLPLLMACAAGVVRHTQHALVVCDMPFGSYEESPKQAFKNASKILRHTNVQAVKIEGGVRMAPTTAFLVERGIPVVAHVGLQPQQVRALGGYSVQGKTTAAIDAIVADGLAQQQAGAFMCVAECISAQAAQQLTAQLSIPVIGIGARYACDGEVAVADDIIGLSANTPPFVQTFANTSAVLANAFLDFANNIRQNKKLNT